MLTPESLHGLWAALPVPWDDRDAFDEETYRADARRLIAAKVHGIYSGGTAGEFYAQSYEEFCAVNAALVEECRRAGTPCQVGCTATSTREVVRRMAFAQKRGADGVQIALPFWMPLTDDETVDFFADLYTACPGVPIVHYATGRSKREVPPELYLRIRERAPTLIGCKHTGADFYTFLRAVRLLPEMSFFIGEHLLAFGAMAGGRGSYSSLVYANPRWTLRYYDLCRARRWEEALRMQSQVGQLFDALFAVVGPDYQDSAYDRCLGRLAGFLRCGLRCRPPYQSVPPERLEALRRWTAKHLPDLLEL